MSKFFTTSGTGASQTLSEANSNKLKIYDNIEDAQLDTENLEDGEVFAVKETGRKTVDRNPVGTIIASVMATVDGYLLCDGATEYLIETYPELGARLYELGFVGSDTEHFVTPNLVGAHLEGAATDTVNTNSNYTANDVKSLGAFTDGNNKSHTHTQNNGSSVLRYNQGGGYGCKSSGEVYNGLAGTTLSNGSTGGTVARPNSFSVNYFIRADDI